MDNQTVEAFLSQAKDYSAKYAELSEVMKSAKTPKERDDLFHAREEIVVERFEKLKTMPAVYRLVESASVILDILQRSKIIGGYAGSKGNIKIEDIEYIDTLESALDEIFQNGLLELLCDTETTAKDRLTS